GVTVKEDDSDSHASAIAQKSMDIFNCVTEVTKNSTRAGGHVLQNVNLKGAWCLLSGLTILLDLVEKKDKELALKVKEVKAEGSKPKDGVTKITAMKSQQMFGVVCGALASETVELLSSLMDDLNLETMTADAQGNDLQPAALNGD
ncbi:unnamed protein product, partial [Owenia fusiformis]